MKLAATHPIQYQTPWFAALAARPEVDLEVGFAWRPDAAAQGSGFGVAFEWDVPLLEGYRWRDLERRGGAPRLSEFWGLSLRQPGRWLAGGADALVVTGWNAACLVQLALAARARRVPVLARGDSNLARARGVTRRLGLAAMVRLYSGFLVVGAANREFYRSLGISEGRLFDCPHFVDNDRFARAASELESRRAELRARLGLARDDLVVLFAGKLIPEKNVQELLAAMARAREEVVNLRLVVAGDGPLRAELAARAEALRVPASWTGFVNQSRLPELYALADLLVLPSRSETWGLVVNEALASRLPVIVSDRVGCAPDLVPSGRTGEIYPSGAPGALTAALLRLAADPERRRAAGEAGQRLVLERYSVDRAVAGTLEALAAVAGRT